MTNHSNPCCEVCHKEKVTGHLSGGEKVLVPVCKNPNCLCHRVKGCKCEDDNKLTQALCPIHGRHTQSKSTSEILADKETERFKENTRQLAEARKELEAQSTEGEETNNLRDNLDGTCNCKPLGNGCFFTSASGASCDCKCHIGYICNECDFKWKSDVVSNCPYCGSKNVETPHHSVTDGVEALHNVDLDRIINTMPHGGNRDQYRDWLRSLLTSERQRVRALVEKHHRTNTYEGDDAVLFHTTIDEILQALF